MTLLVSGKRVLVVDDSAFMRQLMKRLISDDPELRVVETARDGVDALEKAQQLRPDVITLDVEMPRLDGLETLRLLMAREPIPVVMVSSLTQRGADETIRALALGAVDFVSKPSGSVSIDLHRMKDEICTKVKDAANVSAARLRTIGARIRAPSRPPVRHRPAPRRRSQLLTQLVVVASSTGGPRALHRLLSPLPQGLRAGFIIVQHLPAGFTDSLARHLDHDSGLRVQEANARDRPVDGVALVAPGGSHLRWRAGEVQLDNGPTLHGVRPAADVTLKSIPAEIAPRTLVIVLTGMGVDGARGAQWLHDCGADVWAQDESSSVVYGMPRAVNELGVVSRSGTPEQMAEWIVERLDGGA